MPKTNKQLLGERGENLVVKNVFCPKCKKHKTLKRLPNNFKCADIVCDFCGYLAQVKAKSTSNVDKIPNTILGAAWKVQKERMDSGIYFPLYIVLVSEKKYSIFYLPVDYQDEEIFIKRKPLSKDAKRAGWQGFYYDLTKIEKSMIRRLV
ncbi:MAG: DpnI domain-containing protein [Bacteroidota bacterium]|nr:DpnI domain-containing protein [Bacteroidota bacterium]